MSFFTDLAGSNNLVQRVLAADVRKQDTDGGSGFRPDIFPSSNKLYPQAERADCSARAVW